MAQRRRTKKLRVFSGAAMVLALGATTTVWLTRSETLPPSGAGAQLQPPSSIAVAVVDDAGVSIDDAISVDEVWLLDVGDDAYDWGVVVSADEPVGELVVTANFLGVDGESVGREVGRIVRLVGDESVIVGGSADNDEAPRRISVSIRFGDAPSARASHDSGLEVLAFERVSSGTLDDDVLSGTLGISDDHAGASVEIVALWRDDEGAVAAAVFSEVDVSGAASVQEVPFEMVVQRGLIPTGPPSSVHVRWLD